MCDQIGRTLEPCLEVLFFTINMAPKTLAWSNKEVETFLGILGEVDVQRELDGAVRNEKVFQLVSGRMAIAGYEKNTEQCRQKCKKLRAEYQKAFGKS